MMKLVSVGDSTAMIGDRPAALVRINPRGEIAAYGRRRVGWVSWSALPMVTRRLQRACTGQRPSSWRDGFCLRLRGRRCLLVTWPKRRA